MSFRREWIGECALAMKFAGVGLIGFATDALILHLGLSLGLEAAWARVISLVCAMQVTFTINGLVVFKCLELRLAAGQWTRYMLSNGAGNFCNYWIFVTLVSTHWPVVSAPMGALTIAAATAWVINYFGARFIAFAGVKRGAVSIDPVRGGRPAYRRPD
jgi:putative flippase GtrA